MIKTLRMNMMMGFLPLLAILVGLGLWAIVMFYGLGGNIDVILRENYRSVLAVERMKEALERMDSGLMFGLSGRDRLARTQFDKYRQEFDTQLSFEQGNITLPGEKELVDRLTSNYQDYLKLAADYFEHHLGTVQSRGDFYFSALLPRFEEIKRLEEEILLLNQRNMEQMNQKALGNAASSAHLMIAALVVSVILAVVSARILTHMILEPIKAVTHAARAVSQGNLDQVVPTTTTDELGELSQAFNTMSRTIREFREAGTVRLLRAQKTAQATIDSFPDPVVVVDPHGERRACQPGGPASPPGCTSLGWDNSPVGRSGHLETSPRVCPERPGRLPARDTRPRNLPA